MRLRLVFWLTLLASSLIWFCAMRRSVIMLLRAVVAPDQAGIFAVVDVQHPVAVVLDGPVRPDGGVEGLGVEHPS